MSCSLMDSGCITPPAFLLKAGRGEKAWGHGSLPQHPGGQCGSLMASTTLGVLGPPSGACFAPFLCWGEAGWGDKTDFVSLVVLGSLVLSLE